jgi:hypothetical protein
MDVVATIIFLGIAAGLMSLAAKVYEWRQDVLYGPYLRPSDHHDDR